MTPCPRCGSLVAPPARFCTECGSWVVHPPMTQTPVTGAAIALGTVETGVVSDAPAGGLDPTRRTEIKSIPPLAALRPSAPPPPITEVGRLSPVASPAFPAARITAEASLASIDQPTSRAPRTLLDPTPPSISSVQASSRPKRPLAAFLVSFQYEPLGAYWPLGTGPNLVGRAGGRPDLDVAFADSTVSNEQATIHVEVGHLGIEDRGSTNGTFVNGRPLLAGARAPLQHGDRVRFGSFETLVVVVPYSGPP
ncbi:MAG: zinc ribbon domain-containing protein [Polyangiales bacterium]